MNLTPTEKYLIDWFNHSGYAAMAPSYPQDDRPMYVLGSFDLRELAKAVDKLFKERPVETPGL